LQLHSIGEDFEDDGNFRIDLPSSFKFKLQSVDLINLKTIRTNKINKKTARMFEAMGLPVDISDKCKQKILLPIKAKQTTTVNNKITNTSNDPFDLSPEKKKESRVDIEYFYILLPYIKKFNKYCGLCVRYCNFGIKTGDHNIVLRCNIYCIGRPVCSFSGSLIVANTGSCHLIVNNTTITHTRGVKICRPMRDSTRSLLKKQFAQGAAVYRIYQDQLKKRSIEEKKPLIMILQ
ncbi:unnamed protein product, partial [Rotaria magnacalcarata]